MKNENQSPTQVIGYIILIIVVAFLVLTIAPLFDRY